MARWQERPDGWYQVTLGTATFGLEIRGGVVTQAAPVAGWTFGKTGKIVLAFYERKGARVTAIGSEEA